MGHCLPQVWHKNTTETSANGCSLKIRDRDSSGYTYKKFMLSSEKNSTDSLFPSTCSWEIFSGHIRLDRDNPVYAANLQFLASRSEVSGMDEIQGQGQDTRSSEGPSDITVCSSPLPTTLSQLHLGILGLLSVPLTHFPILAKPDHSRPCPSLHHTLLLKQMSTQLQPPPRLPPLPCQGCGCVSIRSESPTHPVPFP